MNEFEWKEYYRGMVARGSMKPEKEREMVSNCGGQKRVLVPDPANPQKQIEQIEPFDEAVERIKDEIRGGVSEATLLRKADQIIAELRKR